MEHVFTDKEFATDVLQSSSPVFVDFWAPWCPPCLAMAGTIEELAHEVDGAKLKIGKLNIDENPDTAMQYRVMSIPTFIVFQNGQEVERLVGFMSKEEMMSQLSKFLA